MTLGFRAQENGGPLALPGSDALLVVFVWGVNWSQMEDGWYGL